ncbi:hypothetical protein ANAEL_02806 [Anaerolineales bacterium]|nr:hypothetical protein ANAEL_02806 [Anaerolineales bacterium]
MREVIKALVLLVEEDQIDPVFENADKQFGSEWFRIFCNEILDWLRSELFVPRKKPIRFPNNPQWFADFSLFIQNTDKLNELFYCKNYSLDFREEIPYEEQFKIHKYVAENYKPRFFWDYEH